MAAPPFLSSRRSLLALRRSRQTPFQMNERLIGEVMEELRPALVGRRWGKVFQLSAATLVVDFRAADGRYLLLSAEPAAPRLHLVARTVRELEKNALTPSPFALVLRKALGGATLRALTKDEGERVVRFGFSVPDAVGDERPAALIVQLTGRSANLFLLDEQGRVVDSLRPSRGGGQVEGDIYAPPPKREADAAKSTHKASEVRREGFSSLSEALDRHYQRLEAERAFDARVSAAAARLRQQTAALRKLRDNLAQDLAEHGDAEEHRRAGDLLLANTATAVREGRIVRLTDFYAEDAPTVEIEVDENRTLQEEAARRFARYTKAKRAAREIAERLEKTEPELAALEVKHVELERIKTARDDAALAAFIGEETGESRAKADTRSKVRRKKVGEKGRKKESGGKGRALRRYRSSDGYEIIVGRGARENDELTFRVARSYDAWMHAADYPGSHVVVRARSRDEAVPHRTLVEAARLAAHFSQARGDAKVAVNYTQRKFVSKPRGAAPGLVYLSSFRTLLVEPAEDLERI
jgi:predicted ribosome quality control (RQC) complex YloA/Tae2 family protein